MCVFRVKPYSACSFNFCGCLLSSSLQSHNLRISFLYILLPYEFSYGCIIVENGTENARWIPHIGFLARRTRRGNYRV